MGSPGTSALGVVPHLGAFVKGMPRRRVSTQAPGVGTPRTSVLCGTTPKAFVKGVPRPGGLEYSRHLVGSRGECFMCL